jgi:hypothetical protein
MKISVKRLNSNPMLDAHATGALPLLRNFLTKRSENRLLQFAADTISYHAYIRGINGRPACRCSPLYLKEDENHAILQGSPALP